MKSRLLPLILVLAAVLLTGAATVGIFPWSISSPSSGQVLTYNGTVWSNASPATSGTVTSVGVTTANGVSASGGPITSSGSFTFSLGAITPTTVKGLTITTTTGTLTLANSSTLATVGAFSTTFTATGTTALTLPTAGTLATLAGSEALTNKTYNGLTLTSTTGTLTIAAAKIATISNTLTFAGTDGTTMTFPATSATIARTDAANTFTGHQTIEGVTSTGATGTGNLVFSISPAFTGTVTAAAVTTSSDITVSTAGASYLRATAVNNNGLAAALFTTGNGGSLQQWQFAGNSSGASGEFSIRDSTSGRDALTFTKATQAMKLGGTLYAAAGALTTDSSGNVTTASDARLKNIDGRFTGGLDQVLALKPTVFHWNAKSGLNINDRNVGFIAQEVLTVIPEAVGKNPDGYYSLVDRPITAALVNAIKELAARPGTWEIRIFEFLALVSFALAVRANLRTR